MEMTLLELVVLAATAAGLYRLLRPLQDRLEALIRNFLDPKERGVIDAEIVSDRKNHKE